MTDTIQRAKPKLGEGIYTIPDIAEILHLPYQKVYYWFKEYVKCRLESGTNFRYYFENDTHDAVNFYSLIETYVFYQLRERNFPTKKIIEAHTELSKYYNTPYPFATTEMLSSGGQILFRPLDDKESLVTADKKKQYQLKEIIQPFSQKIEFSGENGIAQVFYPLGKKNAVIVSPKRQFGQPTIKDTNIIVYTLFELFEAGESIKNIASLYDLKQTQVKDAIEYMKTAA